MSWASENLVTFSGAAPLITVRQISAAAAR